MVRRLPLHRLVSALNLKAMSPRRFPRPWQVEQMPEGFKVLEASGQALAQSTAPQSPLLLAA
jgi:hypothetical protein